MDAPGSPGRIGGMDMRKIADPFYKSGRWLSLRAAVLRRDRYLCQEALRYGVRRQAETVHHIFPKNEFPELAWEPWNLVALSEKYHDAMHDRGTGALSRRGIELLRRTARQRGMRVPMRYANPNR